MTLIVVEEDRVLRQVQVLLDPKAPPERVAAYADFNSTDADFPAWADALRKRLGTLYPAEVRLVGSTEELRAALPLADVAILESLPFGRDELALAPRLKLVQNFGISPVNIDQAACQARGIPVRILRRRTNVAMAEHTMMLVLALAKRLPFIDGMVTEQRLAAAGLPYRSYDRTQTPNANYGRVPQLRTLRGMTLGLLGFGEIGQETAVLAQAFGMRVLYNKRHRMSAAEEAAHGVAYCSFEDLLATSDFFSVHVPMSEKTRDLIDAAALARMKPDSFLVNTSRAEIVHHDALVDALRSGRIAGAALDVLYGEPVRGDEPLMDMGNVILTPHLGGASRMNGLSDADEMLSAIDAFLKTAR